MSGQANGGPPAAGDAPLALLEDGSLGISVAAETMYSVASWLPRIPLGTTRDPAAAIRVLAAAPAVECPDRPPAMEFYGVRGWITDGRVALADAHGRIGARASLADRDATVWIDAAGELPASRDVFATFTILAGLLLTRLGRALLHAAAVVDPEGGAWLLPASSFGGKTTTCTTLIRGGWSYLSDDHVVLGPDPGSGVRAEGWTRPFHLDVGYPEGAPRGERARVEPGELAPGRWRRSARVAGLLFPRVQAELPTALAPVRPAEAFPLVLRQTPFLMNDPAAAGPVLALLERLAGLPAYELRLGSDSYCDADRLQMILAPARETERRSRLGF